MNMQKLILDYQNLLSKRFTKITSQPEKSLFPRNMY